MSFKIYISLIYVVLIQLCGSDTSTPRSILDIYPNTSIIYKPNSKHNISCVGYNLTHNAPILLYQIKNGNIYLRANSTSNVLSVVLLLDKSDNGTSLQCYTIYKYYSKYNNMINLTLNSTRDVQSEQDERKISPDVSSQETSANEESYMKTIGLITAVIIIIILIIIIIFLVMREQRSKSQVISRSDKMTPLQTYVNTSGLQTNMDQWKNNKCEANDNHYVLSDYYSYADNEIHGIYNNLENEYYECFNKQ